MRLTSYRYSTVPKGSPGWLRHHLPNGLLGADVCHATPHMGILGLDDPTIIVTPILTYLSIALPTVTLLLISNNAYVTKKY